MCVCVCVCVCMCMYVCVCVSVCVCVNILLNQTIMYNGERRGCSFWAGAVQKQHPLGPWTFYWTKLQRRAKQGWIQDFFFFSFFGGGAQKIIFVHTHHERKVSTRWGVQGPLKVKGPHLEAFGVFDALSCYLSLFLSILHDTKWDAKKKCRSKFRVGGGGGGGWCAPS